MTNNHNQNVLPYVYYFFRILEKDAVVFRRPTKIFDVKWVYSSIRIHIIRPQLQFFSLVQLKVFRAFPSLVHKYTNDRMNIILHLRVPMSLVNELSLFILIPFYLYSLVIYFFYDQPFV